MPRTGHSFLQPSGQSFKRLSVDLAGSALQFAHGFSSVALDELDVCESPDDHSIADIVEVSDPLDGLLEKNREWAAARVAENPAYFDRLANQQAPEYLWVGCADSRVPANVILGLAPGEVFVQRNVGNQALHTDLNCMSCIEYAVSALKVKNIIVCGHYGCGAVKAALHMPPSSSDLALVNYWIAGIRDCRNEHRDELKALPSDAQFDRLCELNVLRQVFHVCTSPAVQAAWAKDQDLKVYGLCYSLADGLLKKLAGPISAKHDASDDLESFVTTTQPILHKANLLMAASGNSQGPTSGGSPTARSVRMGSGSNSEEHSPEVGGGHARVCASHGLVVRLPSGQSMQRVSSSQTGTHVSQVAAASLAADCFSKSPTRVGAKIAQDKLDKLDKLDGADLEPLVNTLKLANKVSEHNEWLKHASGNGH